ncbi:MAG: type II toxin-antitoxin system HicB family antitoxin [Clostridia bacterium]|nr:type II toxin-antitoxin system HicB family antitoxin [Clostridia bacterium]
MSVKSTVIIQKEDEWYVATALESGVASQGRTMEESLNNLREALELYFEDNVPEQNNDSVFITTMEVMV